MGQKINPLSFRLGVNKGWLSRWFIRRNLPRVLREDYEIRKLLSKHLSKAGIEKIEIERSADSIRVILFTSRPGFVIGRGGEGIENLKKTVEEKILELRGKSNAKLQIKLDVEEIRKVEAFASLVAQNMAEQLEKRIPFRRVLKQTIEKVFSNKDVFGVKVMVKGRLGGSEMSRTEWLRKGRIPLHTLRADIDYSAATAFNTYGTVGVKVWIYKGDVFEEGKNKNK